MNGVIATRKTKYVATGQQPDDGRILNDIGAVRMERVRHTWWSVRILVVSYGVTTVMMIITTLEGCDTPLFIQSHH